MISFGTAIPAGSQQCTRASLGRRSITDYRYGAHVCVNDDSWTDRDGKGCIFYEQNPKYCSNLLVRFYANADGKSAEDMCCICRGGTRICQEKGWKFPCLSACSNSMSEWWERESPCKCKVGFSGADKSPGEEGVCSVCPAGTFKDTVGSAKCSPCPADSYCTGGASITSCIHHSTSRENSSKFSDCTCKAGYNMSTTSSVCICAEGHTGPDSGTCEQCLAGKYKSVLGSASCVDCPSGTFSSVSAATSLTACVSCPSDSLSPAGSATQTSCVCTGGFTGPNNGPCTKCVLGKYKPDSGSATCLSTG